MMNNMILVFSKSPCIQCDAVKQYYKKRGVPFTEVRVDEKELALEMIKSYGYSSVPVVMAIRDESIVYQFSGYRPEKLDLAEKHVS